MKLNGRTSSIIISALVIGAVGTVLYTTRTPKASVKEMPVLVTNETENLQVVSSTIEAGRLILVVKNTGNQPIIGYHFDWKAKEGLNGDLTNANALAPGSDLTIAIPLNQLERDATAGSYKLNLAMAIFEDGNAEGDWTRAQECRDRIAGAALAAPQIQAKIAHVNRSDLSAVKNLSDDLKTLFTPPGKLTKWRQIGYEEAVIRAYGQAQIMLREQQFPDKVEKRMIELRSSAERQLALHRHITEGRTQ
jgi:hypothetical protein